MVDAVAFLHLGVWVWVWISNIGHGLVAQLMSSQSEYLEINWYQMPFGDDDNDGWWWSCYMSQSSNWILNSMNNQCTDTKHARHPILSSILQPTILTPTHTRMSNKCPPTIKLLRLLRNAQRRINCTCRLCCATSATVTVTDSITNCAEMETMLCIWPINATLRSIPTRRNGFLMR